MTKLGENKEGAKNIALKPNRGSIPIQEHLTAVLTARELVRGTYTAESMTLSTITKRCLPGIWTPCKLSNCSIGKKLILKTYWEEPGDNRRESYPRKSRSS